MLITLLITCYQEDEHGHGDITTILGKQLGRCCKRQTPNENVHGYVLWRVPLCYSSLEEIGSQIVHKHWLSNPLMRIHDTFISLEELINLICFNFNESHKYRQESK